jgi:SAM-dependent methyltransferase
VSSFIGFVPTHPEHIDAFFELAPLSSSDVLYDLGSGDGRLLFAAVEKGVGTAVGVELDPKHVRKARRTARGKGLEGRITFLEAGVADVDLANASVVFSYLSPTACAALKPKFELELMPGTRVVVEAFPVPGWEPDRTTSRGYSDYYEVNEFFLYIIPPRRTVNAQKQ